MMLSQHEALLPIVSRTADSAADIAASTSADDVVVLCSWFCPVLLQVPGSCTG
jgi:hypothetical protein